MLKAEERAGALDNVELAVAPAAIALTSGGTARGRFELAIHRRHLQAAEMAAREMGGLSLGADAPELVEDGALESSNSTVIARPVRVG